MRRVDFNVEDIVALEIEADAVIKGRDFLSPYVWEEDGKFHMLVRSAPKTLTETGNTGMIHHGESDDGVHFHVHAKPVLKPSQDGLDVGGCEDPTVVKWDGQYIVYYTGVDQTRSSGQMLYATGPSVDKLEKRGVALASSKTEGNTKEATIERTADGHWRLFYEFARDNASLIGLALGEDVAGPWREQHAPFAPRQDLWDNWHLSTGPLLTSDPEMPVMFYNGATIDARWRIGWIAFNRDYTEIVDRCLEPLITPPPPKLRTDTDIAFASSVLARDDCAHLYFSRADQLMFRAIVRRS
jgi:beta-1,2-mannobiose phosphorylase / 1,2-beta-oligomannan phosphorylase